MSRALLKTFYAKPVLFSRVATSLSGAAASPQQTHTIVLNSLFSLSRTHAALQEHTLCDTQTNSTPGSALSTSIPRALSCVPLPWPSIIVCPPTHVTHAQHPRPRTHTHTRHPPLLSQRRQQHCTDHLPRSARVAAALTKTQIQSLSVRCLNITDASLRWPHGTSPLARAGVQVVYVTFLLLLFLD